ncbi:MAG: hypothetical protein methR_P0265 [Methyloprofundus sp.]|nr:MAG: hypothetical protein methR_P0265 [Methyloprofundus sp.]
MNIEQMTHTIKRFRAADVSLIKDAKLRNKAQKLQAKQSGFTLLELLVVITLLATLATGALVAYEGIGENAQDTATAGNILAAETAIRNYRAVEDEYPEQWDNLANVDGTSPATGGMMALLAPQTQAFFGQWAIPLAIHTTTPAGTVYEAVATAMGAVGIAELQAIDSNATFTANVVPNLALNESSPFTTNPGAEIELNPLGALFDEASPAAALALSIVPSSKDAGTCTADGVTIADTFSGTTVTNNKELNLINDAMDSEICQLVLAVGFGKDVPGSTIDSRVAISQAPTAGSANVNPAANYARYVALFQVATDTDDDGIIQADEVFNRARLVSVVDAEGRTVDEALAGANAG